MPRADAATTAVQPPVVGRPLSPDKRLDAAHAVAQSDASTLEAQAVDAAIEDPPERFRESEVDLRLQAQQLAHHLESWQADLDRREAQVQAKLAALEQQTRSAQLWLEERYRELQEGRLPRSATRESTGPAGFECSGDTEAEALAAPAQLGALESAERWQRLIENEAALDRERAALAAQLESFAKEREDWNQECVRKETRRAAEWGERERGLADDRQALLHLSQQLDERQTALEQLAAKVSHERHQALTERLAAEEACQRLSTAHGSAGLKALDAMREQLANAFRDTVAQLNLRRAELAELRGELAAGYEDLARQRQQQESRMLARQEDLDRRAASLTERESQVEEHWRQIRNLDETRQIRSRERERQTREFGWLQAIEGGHPLPGELLGPV